MLVKFSVGSGETVLFWQKAVLERWMLITGHSLVHGVPNALLIIILVLAIMCIYT